MSLWSLKIAFTQSNYFANPCYNWTVTYSRIKQFIDIIKKISRYRIDTDKFNYLRFNDFLKGFVLMKIHSSRTLRGEGRGGGRFYSMYVLSRLFVLILLIIQDNSIFHGDMKMRQIYITYSHGFFTRTFPAYLLVCGLSSPNVSTDFEHI